MIELIEKFNQISGADVYQRVDSQHPVDLYVGKDEYRRWTLLMVCDMHPKTMISSKMIQVRIGQREDNQWSVSFILIDDSFNELFARFCSDIIESSRNVNIKAKAERLVINRYYGWKKMLASFSDDLLSKEVIKGLFGEIFFLNSELVDRYGALKSIQSWTGPRSLHQDFIMGDVWYEVKTISSSQDYVQISSIEQLDSAGIGHLVIIHADQTSITNNRATNINTIYRQLLDRLTDDDTRELFCNTLLKFGYYPRPEYEESDYTFEIKDVIHYSITEDFPCLRKNLIPPAVVKAVYSISLSAIEQFKEEQGNGTN